MERPVTPALQDALLTAMAGAGIHPHPMAARIRADGRIHRYRIDGDGSGTANGWYVLHLDHPPAAAFGSWKHGVKEIWRPEGPPRTAAERAKAKRILKMVQEKARLSREAAQERTAMACLDWWSRAMPAQPDHPYLVQKGVPAYGLKQIHTSLLVPLHDIGGRLWNIQRIFEDGRKLFTKGGRVEGLFSPIGEIGSPPRLVICEGWATGATLHETVGRLVLAAMNAGNLVAVAKAARGRWPDSDIVVAADNDRFTRLPDGRVNPGVTCATEAAAAIGARLAVPQFPGDSRGTDFNDLRLLQRQREAGR